MCPREGRPLALADRLENFDAKWKLIGRPHLLAALVEASEVWKAVGCPPLAEVRFHGLLTSGAQGAPGMAHSLPVFIGRRKARIYGLDKEDL